MKKDRTYWMVFHRTKRKHPEWSNKHIGTATWKMLCKRIRKQKAKVTG